MLFSYVPIATIQARKVLFAVRTLTLKKAAGFWRHNEDNRRLLLLRLRTHIFFEFINDNKAQSICLKVLIYEPK